MTHTTQTSRGWVTTAQHKQRSSALVREDHRCTSDREHGHSNGVKNGDKTSQPKQDRSSNAATPVEA